MKIIEKRTKRNGRKHIYFCGLKIFSYKRKIVPFIFDYGKTYPWQLHRVSALHSSVFPKFKNIHQGKDVVIVATGPSLKQFVPIKNAIYIGVNKSYSFDKITLDYIFMQDYTGLKNYIEDSFPYKNKSLIRFYGIEPSETYEIIPESIALRHNALRYYVYLNRMNFPELPDTFAYDLSSEELYGERSVVFPALQFALWTNPKRIYLVGCDCSNEGYFLGGQKSSSDGLLSHYLLLKKFVSIYYPETEIISVNPVGLKGVFKDLYQTMEK